MAGVILSECISRLDNKTPIVAIAIFNGSKAHSKNLKTGNMVQTYILRQDMEPNVAIREGKDEAVCGVCPLKSGNGCYVIGHQGPLAVYRAYLKGKYRHATMEDLAYLRNQSLRIGTYGDPVAIPVGVWNSIVGGKRQKRTGYTHQWTQSNAQAYKHLLMASTASSQENTVAGSMGWRTFRIRPSVESPVNNKEVVCPASEEGGKKVQCVTCSLCSGSKLNAKSVVIVSHGFRKRKASRLAAV
jgi:hypothetical protein